LFLFCPIRRIIFHFAVDTQRNPAAPLLDGKGVSLRQDTETKSRFIHTCVVLAESACSDNRKCQHESGGTSSGGLSRHAQHRTYGFRTETGYRFGGFRRGPFFEPLGTFAASWTHIDNFTLGGTAVNFNDDANVLGRVGLRLGTSTDIWQGTTFEPFVVGSLWGTLSGDHTATLTSTGTVFQFTDRPEDLWGVVSGGVNFFNPSARTSVFAKIDYTFADQTQGVGVRAGMRYHW
jgi:outer membrane autotransporter protein